MSMREVRKITFLEKRKNKIKAVYQTVHTVKNVPRESLPMEHSFQVLEIQFHDSAWAHMFGLHI